MSSEQPFSRRTGHDSARHDSPEHGSVERESVDELVGGLMASDQAPEPRESFWSDVEAKLEAEAGSLTRHDPLGGRKTDAAGTWSERAPSRPWAFAAAAAIVLLGAIGVTGLVLDRNQRPTTVELVNAAPAVTVEAQADETPTAAESDPDESATRVEEQAEARAKALAIRDRVYADLTADEQAALENYGRAATALYHQDGGLFFSLLDLNGNAWNDEAETARRVRCFIDEVRAVTTVEEFAHRPTMTDNVNLGVAVPAVVACVPAEEIFDRALGSFLWGHSEYSNNEPPLTEDHPCVIELFPTAASFVARVLDTGNGSALFRESCLGVEPSVPSTVEPSAPSTVESPRFTLPGEVASYTPVGYGRVVGLTADRTSLYTLAAAPGTDQTCLESRRLQFYLQPLDGGPRISASDHLITGESVSAFASDGTHAAWVEFCEFGESWYIAELAADATLVNVRRVAALSGDQQFGNVSHLEVRDGVVTGWVHRAAFDRDVVERVTVDVISGALVSRTEVGTSADVTLPGVVVGSVGRQRVARLDDGRELPLPENHGATFAHDVVTDTLYLSVYAATPGDSIIIASGTEVSSDFVPVGLRENESVLATNEDGRSWLVRQRGEDCASTIVQRSMNGLDEVRGRYRVAVDRIELLELDRWVGTGHCGFPSLPTYVFGRVWPNPIGGPGELAVDQVWHMQLSWGSASLVSADDDGYLLEMPWTDPPGSVTVSDFGRLSMAGVNRGELTVQAPGLPVLIEPWDGWTLITADRATLRLHHTTGSLIDIYDAADGVALDDFVAGLTEARTVLINDRRGVNVVEAAVVDQLASDSGEIISSAYQFSVDGTDVLIHVQPGSTDSAREILDSMLATITFDGEDG